ncbi:unnamed protein product [marine sediment metagenome]|uniref:PqqD family protein n=1 Tax=marine sediment metagenome TaxID=412755 RepID=X1HSM0_9ZZZZ
MNELMKFFIKNPNIVSRKIAGEVILVPIRKNVGDLESIYTLNEVAARIWELIDGKRKIGEIEKVITDEFDITSEKAERDIEDLLRQLVKIGAITKG